MTKSGATDDKKDNNSLTKAIATEEKQKELLRAEDEQKTLTPLCVQVGAVSSSGSPRPKKDSAVLNGSKGQATAPGVVSVETGDDDKSTAQSIVDMLFPEDDEDSAQPQDSNACLKGPPRSIPSSLISARAGAGISSRSLCSTMSADAKSVIDMVLSEDDSDDSESPSPRSPVLNNGASRSRPPSLVSMGATGSTRSLMSIQSEVGAFAVDINGAEALDDTPVLTPHEDCRPSQLPATVTMGTGSTCNPDDIESQVPNDIDMESVANITTAMLIEDPVSIHLAEEVDAMQTEGPNQDEKKAVTESKQAAQHTSMKILACGSLLIALVLGITFPIALTSQSRDTAAKTSVPTTTPTASSSSSPTASPPTAPPTFQDTPALNLPEIVTSVSDPTVLSNETSPQSRALDWLLQDPHISLIPANETFRVIQRYVLAVLFFSTGGGEQHWSNDYSFLSDTNECTWTDGVFSVKGCNNQDAVTVLDFSEMGLTGSIPSELQHLPHLGQLRFLNNPDLTGSLPSQLGRLTDLTFLSIVGNHMTGTIPSTYGSLTLLQGLWLHRNALTGTIPESLGGLNAMKWFWLHENTLTGTVPDSLENLANASSIWLYGNQLEGSVDFICHAANTTGQAQEALELSVDRGTVQCNCCQCCD